MLSFHKTQVMRGIAGTCGCQQQGDSAQPYLLRSRSVMLISSVVCAVCRHV